MVLDVEWFKKPTKGRIWHYHIITCLRRSQDTAQDPCLRSSSVGDQLLDDLRFGLHRLHCVSGLCSPRGQGEPVASDCDLVGGRWFASIMFGTGLPHMILECVKATNQSQFYVGFRSLLQDHSTIDANQYRNSFVNISSNSNLESELKLHQFTFNVAPSVGLILESYGDRAYERPVTWKFRGKMVSQSVGGCRISSENHQTWVRTLSWPSVLIENCLSGPLVPKCLGWLADSSLYA